MRCILLKIAKSFLYTTRLYCFHLLAYAQTTFLQIQNSFVHSLENSVIALAAVKNGLICNLVDLN